MERTIEELAAKIDGLNAWDTVLRCNWAIKPSGCAMPYFCCAVKDDAPNVKVRLLLLEGWQTFQDYVRTRIDHDFGFYLSPMEFSHYELIIRRSGEPMLGRHDPGYVPVSVDGERRELCAKMLWEVYGVMLRLESDRNLPIRFADDRAMFARVESPTGEWRDEPLSIPSPRPHVERVSFPKKSISEAKDVPLLTDMAIELDLRLLPGVMTTEPHARLVYLYMAVNAGSGEVLFSDRLVMEPETGLRGIWESLPPRLLSHFVKRREVPGEIRLCSGRLFRLLRPLGMELPFKLVKCESLRLFPAALKNLI